MTQQEFQLVERIAKASERQAEALERIAASIDPNLEDATAALADLASCVRPERPTVDSPDAGESRSTTC